jgi:hypothetical protein
MRFMKTFITLFTLSLTFGTLAHSQELLSENKMQIETAAKSAADAKVESLSSEEISSYAEVVQVKPHCTFLLAPELQKLNQEVNSPSGDTAYDEVYVSEVKARLSNTDPTHEVMMKAQAINDACEVHQSEHQDIRP